MKSFHVISIILLCIGVSASAQWKSMSGPEGSPIAANVLEDGTSETVIEFDVAGYNQKSIDIENNPYLMLSVPEAPIFLEKGYPELPRLNRSIVIPDEAKMKVEIVEAEYDTVDGVLIAPSKGSLSRSIDPQTVPYTFSDFYKTDTFWPANTVELSQPFLLRDMRGITVQFNLFRHNAVKKQLIVCKRLVVRVYADGIDDVNVNRNRSAKLDRDFNRLYQRFFLNFSKNKVSALGKAAYDDIDETGRMLIIAADDFYDKMIPLRDWRTRKKYKTTLVNCSTAGTTDDAIRNYIQGMFNEQESVTYILLVGDGTNIPSKGVPYFDYPDEPLAPKDPKYTLLAGGDNYPDAYISRLSAGSVTQVENQVRRIIKYETNPASGSWFKKATGIASHEYANGTTDIARCNSLRDSLLAYGYTSVDQLYDYEADPYLVMTALESGRGYVNYIGHGDSTCWFFRDPAMDVFTLEDVRFLSNANLLPFVFSVACQVGSFADDITCFAEAWLRSGTASNPTGAIGFYGSSIDQPWFEPYEAQKEAAHLLKTNAKISIGGLCFNGSCKMIQDCAITGPEVFNTWHIFGDAATNIWTNTPYEIPDNYISVNDYSSSIRVQTYGTWDICVSSGNNGASFHAFVEEDNNEVFSTSVRPLYITVSDHNVIPYTVVTGGTFSSNETWCGNIFVRGDVTVASGYTLTVMPGTKVTFATTDDQSGGVSTSKCELIVNGTLKADSTTFTCSTKGAWYGIRFTSSGTNNSYLKKCTIKNAYWGVYIDSKSPQIYMCFIDDALQYGIAISGSSAQPLITHNYIEGDVASMYHLNGGNGYFNNNSFRNTQYGVYVASGSPSPAYDYYNVGKNIFETTISRDKVKIQSGQPILKTNQYFTIPNTGYKYIANGTANTIQATDNYWSAYPPSSTYFSGSVNRSNPLSSPPAGAGPAWSLPKTSGEEFFIAFDQARFLFYDGKYSEAEEDFMKLAEEYKSLEESSYAVNWAMLASEQLGKLESQGEYLKSVKGDDSFHENARFYALKWLVQNELRGGSVEKALKLAAEIDPGSAFDREISLDLATGLFYYQDDKGKAEEILDNLSKKFTDESTAEVIGLLKEGFVKDVIKDNPNIETVETTEEEPLFSAFPTPFNAETKIRYRLADEGHVSIVLYNILGQMVLTLVDEKIPAGTHEVIWDGTNAYGMIVPSGMYLCRLETPNTAKTIKLLMTK